jgi:hypothetical protein
MRDNQTAINAALQPIGDHDNSKDMEKAIKQSLIRSHLAHLLAQTHYLEL